uniref:Uncharacterized protein n=1 Tax=Aegilops tauschii TaxID=37682 RepID=M8AYQ2_AEGTA
MVSSKVKSCYLLDLLGVTDDEDVYISLLRDSADTVEVAAVHTHIVATGVAPGLPPPLAYPPLLAYARHV